MLRPRCLRFQRASRVGLQALPNELPGAQSALDSAHHVLEKVLPAVAFFGECFRRSLREAETNRGVEERREQPGPISFAAGFF
jgi:hypothetical protein